MKHKIVKYKVRKEESESHKSRSRLGACEIHTGQRDLKIYTTGRTDRRDSSLNVAQCKGKQ